MLASDEAVPDMIPYTAWASGEVQLANGGDEVLILDGEDTLVDAMSYGDKTTFFDPPCFDVAAGPIHWSALRPAWTPTLPRTGLTRSSPILGR
jgi:hypothetical protein